jgi:WD40-like Beta Propeller Repeat
MDGSRTLSRIAVAAIAVVALVLTAAVASAGSTASWGDPTNLSDIPGTHPDVNSPYTDGCPMQSPSGLRLYMASNRPGGMGGLDIWMASRERRTDAWGEPVNLGDPVNSAADDFCPSPTRWGRLFFVSTRDGGCGGADIYLTRRHGGVFGPAANLGCDLNSGAGEASPSFVDAGRRPVLYFSSNRAGGFAPEAPGAVPDSDIYVSTLRHHHWRAARQVAGLNTTSEDARPNVRHDGLEVVFDSTRPGTLGGPDIYTARRARLSFAWSVPENLGAPINSPSSESRASLSWDAKTLYFGSNRPGGEPDPVTGLPSNDIYRSLRNGS